MRILLSNDDGVHAAGLAALYRELVKNKKNDVWVVAPSDEKSTTGHSLTLHKPLRLHQVADRFFSVTGSPADCIYVGIREVLKKDPDVIISGINRGANLGQDVYYSGTVSAAREASMIGIPSYAVSLAIDFRSRKKESQLHYGTAAKVMAQILKKHKEIDMPLHTLINVNVPDVTLEKIKGFQMAQMGFRYYSGTIVKRRDHRGKDYFWIGGQYKGYRKKAGEDCAVVDSGFVSITPIKLDSTDQSQIKRLTSVFEK